MVFEFVTLEDSLLNCPEINITNSDVISSQKITIILLFVYCICNISQCLYWFNKVSVFLQDFMKTNRG